MRSTLDEFLTDINELQQLVESIVPVSEALAEHGDSRVRRYLTIRRRFDYAAFVVALYASLEKFMESLVGAYAQLIARRVRYSELPQSLSQKHLNQTADMLARGRIGEGRYAGLTQLGLVTNLFNCLNDLVPYELNDAAIAAHDVNLRASEIDRLFASVGLDNICARARNADELRVWHMKAEGLEKLSEAVPATTIVRMLEDIVERRNQVAHRGGVPASLLGPDDMLNAIDFVKAFSNSIFAAVAAGYLAGSKGISLRMIEKKIHASGFAIVVERPLRRIDIGQAAFAVAHGVARWGRIKTLRINGRDVDAVEPSDDAPTGVGVGFDFKCSADASVTVLANADDAVWNPNG